MPVLVLDLLLLVRTCLEGVEGLKEGVWGWGTGDGEREETRETR